MAQEYRYFTSAKNFSELDDLYEMTISPENLSADGERTAEEQREMLAKIEADYQLRLNELCTRW